MKHKILLVEDQPERAEEIIGTFPSTKELGIECYQIHADVARENEALRAQLERDGQSIALLVLDVELTKGELKDRALYASQAIVDAQDLGIPVVVYAQKPLGGQPGIPVSQWSESHIYISRHVQLAEALKRVAAIAKGFIRLQSDLQLALKDGTRDLTDPVFVGRLLGAPESAMGDVAAYLRGHFEATPPSRDILVQARKQMRANSPVLAKIFAASLGYWIYNVVLQFPGLLANRTALASALDVDPDELGKKDLASIITPFVYNGPMEDVGTYYWVNATLDAISELPRVAASDPSVGKHRARLQNHLGRSITGAACLTPPAHPAGLFCIFEQKPVCEEHSLVSNLIPKSAWLSRVSKDWEDIIGPWMPH